MPPYRNRRSRRSSRRRSRSNRRRSRSNRRRNHRRPRYTIHIPTPEQCMPSRGRSRSRTRTYCGKRSRIPPGYTRKGTQYECLKKGFGTGRCSIYRFRD